MGEPTACAVSYNEYIVVKKQTWGTETSHYPEERKSTETPLVAASERGPGHEVVVSNENRLESLTEEGDSPVLIDGTMIERVGRDT